jgi:hypothetical protein
MGSGKTVASSSEKRVIPSNLGQGNGTLCSMKGHMTERLLPNEERLRRPQDELLTVWLRTS